ncbi:hypothetical protein [uncultured Lacinutrix sp.]|uniref:hypothetical protein n=1 Tax=uncultured Lacinutrix sp. TaxID=574032 RepID=UPI00260F23AD|nr:hypothetical protein [uncultured Lacinutrix sp.]
MRRVIVDYKKLTPEVLTLLTQKYPDGYGDDDILVFDNHKNETIEAVEVRTDEIIYLVKISSKLHYTMANFDDTDDLVLNNEGHIIINESFNNDEEE